MSEHPESTNVSTSPVAAERTLADAHRDIDFGNSYRLEYIKHLISIATGVFVFSVTFMKDFIGKPTIEASCKFALPLAWCALIVSIGAGIFHMRYWAWFYISWGTQWTDPKARKWRRTIDNRRKGAERIQIYGFVVGLFLLLLFATWNLYVPSKS